MLTDEYKRTTFGVYYDLMYRDLTKLYRKRKKDHWDRVRFDIHIKYLKRMQKIIKEIDKTVEFVRLPVLPPKEK